MKATEHRFSTRWGLILSVLGIAVGTGNIWRFPRIAAQNAGDDGAGAFLLIWLLFLFSWSIPLIIAEYAIGRHGRKGVVGSFIKMAGPQYAWMGAFVGFVTTAIMFYYSVVAGWCLYYTLEVVTNPLPLTTDAATGVWNSFQGSGWMPVGLHFVAMFCGALVVMKGVSSIERVNKILIPTLFAIVLVALLRSVTLDGSLHGLAFLFTPDWATLADPKVWLAALTQNAWDTGAGWGLILTYGAYMKMNQSVVKNSFITGIGNNLVSLIAAITIFGTVFAILGSQMEQGQVLSIMQESGPAATGLTFIWMPQLFAQMDGGTVLAFLFFVGLAFAAFSSLISMIELACRVLVDMGIERKKAVVAVCSIGFTLGIPSALYLNFLGNQDFVWGVALMISGAFVAFSVIKFGTARFRSEQVNAGGEGWQAGAVWDVLVSKVVPSLAGMLLIWWLYRSKTEYATDTWFDPTDPYSLMTCIVQWGVALVVLIWSNKYLVRRTSLA